MRSFKAGELLTKDEVFQQCRTTYTNSHEAAQTGAEVQRLLAGQFSQTGPVLDEMDEQYALKTNRRTLAATLGVVLLDHSHSLAQGTIASKVFRNSPRLVDLRCCSYPH